ncbi:MAG: class I SAM-dependent methyltransferase [Planctomycetes bacterium]|nr:class I SAM-dependent methyltransferase [Planctomycetota bacterium]
MFQPVGSTSWHNRHREYFRELDAILRRSGRENPTVMIIGPGAVTTIASLFLNDAATNAGSIRKLIGDAARYSDQLLRRIPFLPLTSLEPCEVESILTVPHRLIVVDRSQRILDAVARRLHGAICLCADLSLGPPPATADVVIAFNIVCRLEDPSKGIRNVSAAVNPGGWLLIDDRSADAGLKEVPEFAPVAPKIHRRATTA